MQVGFAGLGRMGRRMAANLRAAGHDLVLWNRTLGPAEALAGEIGAQLARSPRDLAERSEAVLTMLAEDTASAEVHHGAQGLFAASGGAGWFVEMGTMSPDHIRALARAAPEGVTVIDAPVSGATQAAADATLMIMAGATEAQIDPLRPLFDALGRQTIALGAVGQGAVMKLAVNALIHGMNQTLAEALTLSEAAGIAPERAFEAIEASAAAAPMFSYRRGLYLDEAAHDVTFTVALARKDMAVTCALGAALGLDLPQGRLNLDRLEAALARGYGARDMAAMVTFMREEAK